jgi:transposase
MIDSVFVKAHRSAGGAKGALAHGIGRFKGGRTTNVHLVTDVDGRTCVMAISLGNTSDFKAARQCLAAMPPAKHIIVDKGYDSDDLRQWLEARGTTPLTPPRSNRKIQYACDKTLFRKRKLIERTVNSFKAFRSVATRFDRKLKKYMAALCIVATVIW